MIGEDDLFSNPACEAVLAEEVGLGTRDLKRIEVVGLAIKEARIDFGPGAVGKTLSELKA